MAENVTLNTMTGGSTIGADEITSVHYQRVKLIQGADGVNDGDVSSAAPLNVTVPTAATSIAKAEDAVHASGDVGVMALAVRDDTIGPASGAEGDYEPLHTDANGALWVSQLGVAHDAPDTGFPIKGGGKAISSLAGVTLVASLDRTDQYCDLDGAQMVKQGCPFGDILSERVSNTDGASTALAVFGATASAKNFITTIIGYNTSASGCYVDIRDGTAGSILMTLPLPAGGGCAISFPVPLKQSTANTALAFDVSAATTTVYLTFLGFKSKVA